MFQTTSAAIALHEPETARFSEVNSAYANTLGYDPSELDGRSLFDITNGDVATLEVAIKRVRDGESAEIETVLTRADGTPQQVQLEFDVVQAQNQTQLLSTLRVEPAKTDRTATTMTA